MVSKKVRSKSRPKRAKSTGSAKGRRGSRQNKPQSYRGKKNPKSAESSHRRSHKTSRSTGLGGDHIEGRQAVRELLLAGKRPVSEVILLESKDSSDIVSDIEHLAQEVGVTVRRLQRSSFLNEAVTSSHQGVVAKAKPLEEASFDELLRDENAFLLVLDGVTDPGNVGAIVRTAECVGVTGIVISKHRSVKVTPTVAKIAAGAVEHVPLSLVGGIPAALSQMAENNVTTFGLDSGAQQNLFTAPTIGKGPIALVLGAEGAGLSRLVRQRVDQLVSLPMRGGLNSLNVATAGAVACYEVVRRRESEST